MREDGQGCAEVRVGARGEDEIREDARSLKSMREDRKRCVVVRGGQTRWLEGRSVRECETL